jgi:helix-turn-helix, Psq domain
MDKRESMLQLALADLESGKYTSIRQAAKAYNVPRSTWPIGSMANLLEAPPTNSSSD